MTTLLLAVAIWRALIAATADRYDVDATLVEAIVAIESRGNPRAVGAAGERGLMQLLPDTARRLGVRDAFDPAQNLDGGTRYLAAELRMCGGDEACALASYNCGQRCGLSGRWPASTRAYVAAVLARRRSAVTRPPPRPAAAPAIAPGPLRAADATPPDRPHGSRFAMTSREE